MRISAAAARMLNASFLIRHALGVYVSSNFNGSLPLLRDSYDYIIIGAGIGGLVVANRLSENPEVSVLVIEAGDLDDRAEDISVPGNVGLEDPRRYEVKLEMVAQEFLDGKSRTISQGKAVGGSTIINGLVWTRGSAADFDAWERLGNPGWGWSDLLPYFQKSEKYSENLISPSYNGSILPAPIPIRPVDEKHGKRGPVEVGYPNYYYNQSYNFLGGIQELGIPSNADPNSGIATGAAIVPSSIAAENQSRTDARTAYIDPVLSRPNLHLAAGYTATRILHGDGRGPFSNSTPMPNVSDINITGVEVLLQFAANSTTERVTISCRNEVILAAGAIYSPVLLQVSGFGPADLLRRLGVNIAVDLPGVGSNLQDHPTLQPVYQCECDLPHSFGDTDEHLGPWTAPMVNTVALPPLEWVTDRLEEVLDEAAKTINHLPSSYDPTLRAGYAAQKTETISILSRNDTPAYEVMSTSWGQLAVSVMQPLSRGTVFARSSSVFENVPPIVDPRFCSHPVDCKLLLIALKFNDRLIQTEPMAALMPVPPPGFGIADARNQTALDEVMRTRITSGLHPSGTTSMLPLELGGVVDPSLRVYGTRNLRVVDAGVIPLIPGAHIQAAIYAISEKAADIIKAERPDLLPSEDPYAKNSTRG
ncbi:hypothetical protein AAE478_001550 [Parahypoxylon ruwenzoriense]